MDPRLMDARRAASLPSTELERLARQIGNTPMEPVDLVMQTGIRRIHLKLEGANPTGSMKDRTGLALIQQLEQQGRLHADSIVIESSSGNLGVALSLLCKARGYSFTVVIDPKATQENIGKMQALGAQIDMMCRQDSKGGYLLSRLERVQALCRLSDRYVWTNQYANAANPFIHYSSTAPEIFEQMHGQVGAVFVPVSTGGTLAGVGRFFREHSPRTHIIGVDARGSVVFGAPAAPRKLTGIGSSRPSSFLDSHLYDAHILVGDEEAFAFCRALYASTGMKVGGSSGAVLAACTFYLPAHPELNNIVCICADDGENYSSSIFNDGWLRQHGVQLCAEHLGGVEAIIHAQAHSLSGKG
ncbi:MAG: pyridoxal-phosphate dependent enzyme [Ktedonobacteraceae bacterium]